MHYEVLADTNRNFIITNKQGEYFRQLKAGANPPPPPSNWPRISAQEATRRACKFSSDIHTARDRLRSLLRVHEPTVQRRWKKRNFKQRQAILHAVKPGIPTEHNVAIRLFLTPDEGEQQPPRDVYLLPYVTLEDLCRDYTHLLGLLHHRAASPPAAFVSFDAEQLHCGLYFEVIIRTVVRGYAIKLYGGKKEYGHMISWDDEDENHDSGWNKMMREDALSPGDGLVILEAQATLLQFLVNVVEKILQDVDTSPEYLSSASAYAENALLTTGPVSAQEAAQWTSLAKRHAQRPFLGPAVFSLSMLREIALGKKDMAFDRVWLMRTDPNYFYQTLQAVDQHRPEQVLDLDNKPDPSIGTLEYFHRLAGKVVEHTYSEALHWTVIAAEVEQLAKLHPGEGKVCPGKPLPREYEEFLATLELLLQLLLKYRMKELKQYVMSSPGFRNQFERVEPESLPPHVRQPPSTVNAFLRDPERKMTTFNDLWKYDKLLWLLMALTDNQHSFTFSLENLLDEIDAICDTDKTQAARMSQHVCDKLGEVAALNEMLLNLSYHRPLYSCLDGRGKEQNLMDPGQRWRMLRLGKGTGQVDQYRLGKHILPLEKFKPSAESEDDSVVREFWERVDDRITGDSAGSEKEMREYVTFYHAFARKPEEVDVPLPMKKKEDALQQPVTFLKPVSTTIQPSSDKFEAWAALENLALTPKEKIKTRPEKADIATSEVKEEPQEVRINEEAKLSNEPVQLSTRAARFLSTAIPSLQGLAATTTTVPASKSQSPLFDWSDFLHSMCQLGFSAEKKHGSAWMFLSKEGRSFCVHEPHPRRKLDFYAARFIGKRLERKFGWKIQDFVV